MGSGTYAIEERAGTVLANRVVTSAGPSIEAANGTPEGQVAAQPGSLYLDRSGHLWKKETGTGSTGWSCFDYPNRWTDVLMDVQQASGIAALSFDQYRDTPISLYCFRHDQADTLTAKVQFPHEWVPNTEVRVHMHCIPLADPASAQTVALAGSYCWAHYGAEVPAAAGWTAYTATHPVAPGDINKAAIIPLFSSTPTESAESSILLFSVSINTGAMTYTTNKVGGTIQANLALTYLDAHHQRNKLGTVLEYPT